MPLAAAGQHQHVVAQLGGDLLQLPVDRTALLSAAQLGAGDGGGQPGVPLVAVCEHQQVRAVRVGLAVLRAGQPEESSAPKMVGRASARAASAKRTTRRSRRGR
ncbi:hypothetical protein GCM10027614_26740 [Micromonospora vulcania]